MVLDLLPTSGAEIIAVSEEVMRRLVFGERLEGVLGVADMPRPRLEDLPSRITRQEPPLVAVIEGLEKPGNVGAILRSADGAGLSAVIAADPAADLYNPNAIRASLGAVFTVPVCTAEPEAVRAWLRRHGLDIVATRPDATKHYAAVDYRRPTAIVLGSEATGLSPLWSGPEITTVRLPMLGAVDSLNVAATAAVLFYEARRQRG
jgi:TrmH family RNA methyltransferase